MLKGRFYFFISLLLILAACQHRVICNDPDALNYTDYDPTSGEIVNDKICQYNPNSFIFGTWQYTDTFTYYPPAGGTPQTWYNTSQIQINVYGGNVNLMGFPYDQYYNGILAGDSIVCRGITFSIHRADDTVQYIAFPDGLTNSAVGYMHR